MVSPMVDAMDCGSRDAKEFISLLAAHSQSIYRHIFTLLPDADQAQDVYQECVMALWEKFGEYHADEPFLRWAYRFAHFKVLAQRKKNRRQPALLEDDVLNILVEEQVQENERLEAQLRLLPGCLGKLTPNERRLLQVRYDGRATVAQIAEETGRLAETLYRVLHRARKKLLDCIQRRLALEEGP
jgi:RNA polymerase sigma-70 factor (ECF subfamily)